MPWESGGTRASRCQGDYPWRCLCFGSFLQMTITTPWRRITLQLSQRGFTDARTFTLSLLTYADAARTAPAAPNQPNLHGKPLCHQLEANDEWR